VAGIDRDGMLRRLRERREPWDVLVVGGGATGLGVAVESATRGYSTLLLEASDFASGTSSRSTKLVHGGVRYLRQGNVSLVLEALKERGLLFRNAPHLVRNQAFVVPSYEWWHGPFYGVGLKFYDALAGKLGLGPSHRLSREETLQRIPTLEPQGLRGGIIYHDGQFDDARLALTLALTAADHGAALLNHMPVIGLTRADGLVSGIRTRDSETGAEHTVAARVVINATGVFVDELRRMDDETAAPLVAVSQGVHLVLPREFLPGDSAVMVPQTDDGRVLFAVPWHDRVVVGTTDTALDEAAEEPRALPAEVEFLLTHAARYLTRDPQPSDVLSVFAGLRPLVQAEGARSTAALSRDHTLVISGSGLVTITGGKWTTYRKMAEDTVDQAAGVAGLEERPSRTEGLQLHGWTEAEEEYPWNVYGADADAVRALAHERAELYEPLHPRLPYRAAEVVWAARHEMARTVADVLARRTRALLLDARASVEAAPTVARLMAEELGHDEVWAEEQVEAYRELAAGYVLNGSFEF
jgi:glycerol-3-phosphate dehydrogenase